MSEGLRSLVRDLHRRRARRRRALTLAEGVRLVEEVLRSGTRLRGAVVAPMLQASERGAALKRALEETKVALLEVPDDELVALADTDHPQGVVAVIEPPAHTLEELTVAPGAPLLVLDGVQDPGNVGALCRTARGLGAGGVVALPGTAELYGPKTLRGSMGALFSLPAVRCDDEAFLAWARDADVDLWLADVAGRSVRELDPAGRRIALIVGNEGAGVRADLADRIATRVGIPLAEGVESLNVAVAAGILLHEVQHGR